MSSSIKNVILAGPTGSVGAPILKALLAEPSFKVTILTRQSSSNPAKLPANVPVKTVSDAFTVEELTEAFKGQDAVVIAISTTPITQDNLAHRFIDAAVAAGVKRLIPSEFGANNLDRRARKLVPVYDAKGEMLEYLQKRAAETNGGLTWTSVSCGAWLDWGLNPVKSGNFLDIDVKNRRATIWDSGSSRFTITTSGNTGMAISKILLNPTLTANKQIFLSDFVSTSREIVAELEKQAAQKWALEYKESAPVLKEYRIKFDAGDYNATYPLLAISFVGDVDVGYDFPNEQGIEIWNDKLGLTASTLEEVVKEALERED
ncbi:NAD(P)-binding protein [Amniculicola lignicola CBS 123094]|uniref:NAD(P)-binding protein n=1 Tax=Amniculicola lignicola CBS 123094 TaxID=1392246 RepID=A0A6A5X4X9_9PLEO|nr:NAD(P)-binding protein [Amniculicola lignicola CBS 123094]